MLRKLFASIGVSHSDPPDGSWNVSRRQWSCRLSATEYTLTEPLVLRWQGASIIGEQHYGEGGFSGASTTIRIAHDGPGIVFADGCRDLSLAHVRIYRDPAFNRAAPGILVNAAAWSSGLYLRHCRIDGHSEGVSFDGYGNDAFARLRIDSCVIDGNTVGLDSHGAHLNVSSIRDSRINANSLAGIRAGLTCSELACVNLEGQPLGLETTGTNNRDAELRLLSFEANTKPMRLALCSNIRVTMPQFRGTQNGVSELYVASRVVAPDVRFRGLSAVDCDVEQDGGIGVNTFSRRSQDAVTGDPIGSERVFRRVNTGPGRHTVRLSITGGAPLQRLLVNGDGVNIERIQPGTVEHTVTADAVDGRIDVWVYPNNPSAIVGPMEAAVQ